LHEPFCNKLRPEYEIQPNVFSPLNEALPSYPYCYSSAAALVLLLLLCLLLLLSNTLLSSTDFTLAHHIAQYSRNKRKAVMPSLLLQVRSERYLSNTGCIVLCNSIGIWIKHFRQGLVRCDTRFIEHTKSSTFRKNEDRSCIWQRHCKTVVLVAG